MNKITHKQKVAMTVRLVKNHCHSEDFPIKVLKKEANGDYELLVHRTALSEIYRLANALWVAVVLLEVSKFNPDFYRILII